MVKSPLFIPAVTPTFPEFGIFDDLDAAQVGNAEIAEIALAGIDELMGLAARRCAHEIACTNRVFLLAVPILALAREHEDQLVHDVVAVERERALARRNHMHGAAQVGKADERADAAPFDSELLAIAAVDERHVVDIDHDFVGHPTLPSSEIAINFCASTANSMGSCCSTSLTKPLTTSAVASSAVMPRWRQ